MSSPHGFHTRPYHLSHNYSNSMNNLQDCCLVFLVPFHQFLGPNEQEWTPFVQQSSVLVTFLFFWDCHFLVHNQKFHKIGQAQKNKRQLSVFYTIYTQVSIPSWNCQNLACHFLVPYSFFGLKKSGTRNNYSESKTNG